MSNLLVQNIKHTNNTQSIAVDTSGNVTASGTLTSTGELTASADLKFNSDFGSAGKAFGVRSWINFNGSGTVATNGSGNVSGLTDNGTGNYTISFTNNMPDNDFACTLGDNNWGNLLHQETFPTSGVTVINYSTTDSVSDTANLSVIMVR
tara:strand:+ start:247 stop:696 length:450 start_codon:yes stop_codon:yes gene_type:complete